MLQPRNANFYYYYSATKKLNKTCIPEAYATQTKGVIYLKSGAVVIEGTTAQAYL